MLKNILNNRNLLTLFVTIFIFGFIFIFSYFGVFYSFDKGLQNKYFLIKDTIFGSKISKDLIIVEIDEKTLNELGRFPFDRKVYSPFIKHLSEAGVSVIGFDLIFEDKTKDAYDNLFSQAIENAGNVVFGLAMGDDNSLKEPLQILDNYLLSKGYLRPNVDKNTNTIYSIIPSSIFNGKNYEHFSLSVLKAYYSYIYDNNFTDFIFSTNDDYYYLTPDDLSLTPKIIKIPFARKDYNEFLIQSDPEKEILINYVDRNEFNKISFIDVYRKDNFLELQKDIDFKDKIIVVGTTAKGIKDIFNTPRGVEYGVYVHANIINTVLTKSFIVYFDKNIEWILILLLVIISVYFNLSKSGIILLISNLLLIALFLIFFPLVVLFFTDLVINYNGELIFALIFSFSISNIVRYIMEKKDKLKLNKALSEYVSGDIAEEILYGLGKINLNGEEKNIAILFSDIVGFTSISEKLSPQKLVSFLREYLTNMSDLIMEDSGFINNYEGDAILAFWGVFGSNEEMTRKACLSAIKQQKLLKQLNKKWQKDGFQELKIRIGINVGNAIIGNIGSIGKKVEFTALGDNVNLASRLEGVNKYYKTSICVSESVYNDTKDLFEYRYLDKIKVKGKNIGVKIYELFEEKGKINDMQRDIISRFEIALSLYFKKNFEEALKEFIALAEFGDGPSIEYVDRCRKYLATPPDQNWDGFWVMGGK